MRLSLPTISEQKRWLTQIKPICDDCPEYLGDYKLKPGSKFILGIKCRKSTTCGGKQSIGPLNDCPIGRFKKLERKPVV